MLKYLKIEEPLYQHDCDECIYLGRYKSKSLGMIDLYFHKRNDNITDSDLVARYSDEGPDYISSSLGIVFSYPKGGYREEFIEIISRYYLISNK